MVATRSGNFQTILSIVPRPGPPERVYNLEVNGEHVYFVGLAETNVHNEYPNAPNGASRSLVRGDATPFDTVNIKGRPKSFINQNGDLVPAGTGVHKGRPVKVIEHLLGGYRRGAKANSDFTSFGITSGTAERYRNSTVRVALPGLRQAIRSGEVKGVAILSPKQIRRLIKNATGSGATPHWKTKALEFTDADSEYLIRGLVPKRFLTIEY